jgi:hypothetical protein
MRSCTTSPRLSASDALKRHSCEAEFGGLGTTPRNYGVINFDYRLVVRICDFAVNMALPNEPTTPSRTCEKCNEEMTHLSDLPSFLGRAAIRIFRCYVCDNVVSEDY